MATATILGRQVKRVLVGGVACLAISMGSDLSDGGPLASGSITALVWNGATWSIAVLGGGAVIGSAHPSDKRLLAARAAAASLY